jgi:hypothetical protein
MSTGPARRSTRTEISVRVTSRDLEALATTSYADDGTPPSSGLIAELRPRAELKRVA